MNHFLRIFIALITLTFTVSSYSSELSADGLNQVPQRLLSVGNEKSNARDQIAVILEAERRVSGIQDSMAIKRTGLAYVQDLYDFEFLTTFTVTNPSAAYQTAVGEFIAEFVAQFTNHHSDIETLRILEMRTTTVPQAIKVKSAGLLRVRNIFEYLLILPLSVTSPSANYINGVSSFVAQTVPQFLNTYSPIDLILSAENYTATVTDAMAVKSAGLVAVHSKEDLLKLATFTVSNPSDLYRRAVDAFIRDNIGRYP